MPEMSETLKGSFTKFFGTVRQKIFDGKTWYPLVCIKFFETPSFLKHRRDPHGIFRHYETKNFRRKNVIPPFSSIKLFETKNFLKNSRIPLRKFSALWDIEISSENRDMPPLIHKFFSIPENFRNTEGFLYKAFRFGPVRQKVRTKPWCPPPSYAWKFSMKELFWNTTKVFSNEIFRYSETQTSTENRDTPPFIQTFSIPEIIATVKDYPTESFGTVRQKIFDGKSWYPLPPLWCIKLFATRNFLMHRSVPQRNFSVLWDKKFWTKSRA